MRLKHIIGLLALFFSLKAYPQGCTLSNFMSATRIPVASFPYFSSSSGITVSVTTNCSTLSNFTYPCGPDNYAGASPTWWINAANQYIIFTFSAPVKKLTVLVNGTNQTEVFYFASNGGSPTLSDYCSPDFVASANTVTDVVVPAEGAIISPNVGSATSFTITHNGLGSGSRLTLLDCFIPATVLPIELISFNAECISKNNVQLDWRTSSEFNNNYFTVERSNDALRFTEVKTIPGKNGQKEQYYSCNDIVSGNSTVYYRLKQTDKDGHYTYSGIVTVNSCDQKNDVEIYPNPATDELTVSGISLETIKLFDLTGKEVLGLDPQEGSRVKINVEGLPKGIYFLKVAEKNFKIVKQ